jgi:hypothetical protein
MKRRQLMYKIIQNNKVIDVVRYPQFISFLASGHITMTDKASAEGILGRDNKTIYSFKSHPAYLTVTIEEITIKEFERLQGLLSSEQEVCADESVLAKARQSKISQLSNQCKAVINAGFSVLLADGETYKFKLTAEDQLNLMSIENQLNSGAETVVYHATNQPCRIFSRDDMLKVIKAFRRHVMYHTTYFNAAKQYINSLTDIEKINKFSYGEDVSSIIKDRVIKRILRNGG